MKITLLIGLLCLLAGCQTVQESNDPIRVMRPTVPDSVFIIPNLGGRV